MDIRDVFSDAAAAHLLPDEAVQAVIMATNVRGRLVRARLGLVVLAAGLLAAAASGARPGPLVLGLRRRHGWQLGTNRVIVATSKRILVFAVYQGPKLGEVVGQLPRATQLGPIETLKPYYRLSVSDKSGGQLWVPSACFPDVRLADSWRPVPDGLPVEDHAAHATGRICQRCGHPITARQDARLTGKSDWIHDVCPS